MSKRATTLAAATQTILALIERQLQANQADEWEEMEQLETERLQLIKKAFAQDIVTECNQNKELTLLVRTSIEKIKKAEEKLMNAVKNNRTETGDQLQKLQRGGKAAKAYTQQP